MPLKKKDDSQIVIRRGLDEDERPAIEVRRWKDGGFDPGAPRTVPLTPDLDRVLREIDPVDRGSMPSRLEILGRELATIPGIEGLDVKLRSRFELEITHTIPHRAIASRVSESISVRVRDWTLADGVEPDEVPRWEVRWVPNNSDERHTSFGYPSPEDTETAAPKRYNSLEDIVNVTINLDAPLQPPDHPNCRSKPPRDVFHFTAEQVKEYLAASIPLDDVVLVPEYFRRSLERKILELFEERFSVSGEVKDEPAHPSIVGRRMLWRAEGTCCEDLAVVVQAEDADRRLALVYVCASPGLRLWVDRLDLRPAPEPSDTCPPAKPGNDR